MRSATLEPLNFSLVRWIVVLRGHPALPHRNDVVLCDSEGDYMALSVRPLSAIYY